MWRTVTYGIKWILCAIERCALRGGLETQGDDPRPVMTRPPRLRSTWVPTPEQGHDTSSSGERKIEAGV
jgi:hypothetical protein